MSTAFETRCISSLSKVFADEELADEPVSRGSALRGEVYSFQVAYRSEVLLKRVSVAAECGSFSGGSRITVRSVGLSPSELPCYHDPDDYVLRTTPGLYPDPLYPIDAEEGVAALPGQWRAVWVTVQIGEREAASVHRLEVSFRAESGELLGSEACELEVIAARLQEQRLLHTEWFHTDCLATWYGVQPLSEQHWMWIERYVSNAAAHGVNMLLTPIFTPPLDTAVGGERPTVQLLGIRKEGERYSFDFAKLDRWIDLCQKCGIRYFEMAHLFTQWGARHAPKIIVEVDGADTPLFGWHTDALGDEYRQFLTQLLPALTGHMERRGLQSHVYFHISDEPHLEHLEHYKQVSEFVRSLLGGYPVIDALSNYEFYESGAVPSPIPANHVVDQFIERQVEGLWTYYCCAQYKDGVSNRFFHMPSARSRVLGLQLYQSQLSGFLHWGYNFWFARWSVKAIDPYTNTDAQFSFPSGDAFLVYPGSDGPVDSIRHEVLREAMQDLRALQTLESAAGRAQVLAILQEGVDSPITFKQYPRSLDWLLSVRERVNQALKKLAVEA